MTRIETLTGSAPPDTHESVPQSNGAGTASARTKTQILFLLNDAPYGSERLYNGVRVAQALAVSEEAEVRIFMFGDAVGGAVANQQVPRGYYNVGSMVAVAARHGARIACCGTCMDARGIPDDGLVEGAQKSTLQDAADWILWADKVLPF